jgi:pimeloyl-ACP methyl ester carboxylesterase
MKIKTTSLVQVATADGLYLQGYFAPKEGKRALLHIHGSEGNFYENHFVQVLAKRMEEQNMTFLAVNTRGCEKIKDFNTPSGKYKTVGARYELLEDSPIDINAWIEFLNKEGYEEIVLCGHSLGTMKVVRYLTEGKYANKIKKLILLSPFDKKAFIQSHTKTPIGELLKRAQKMVDTGKGDEMITREFEDVVMSYKTFVSWYKQDELGRMFEFVSKDYDFPALKKIHVPTKIIVGSKDEYFHLSNPDHPEEAMQILLKHIPNSEGKIIEGAVHSFIPHEETLAKEILSFIKNYKIILEGRQI